jgi:hypothetical protein
MANELVSKKIEVKPIVNVDPPRDNNKNTNNSNEETKPPVDTNPNDFTILEVEVNFNKYNIMICDKKFDDEMTLEGAKRACRELNYGGYTDWRLPTKHEAEKIIYYHGGPYTKWQQLSYWTFDPNNLNIKYEFFMGRAWTPLHTTNKDKNFVRPVRDFK